MIWSLKGFRKGAAMNTRAIFALLCFSTFSGYAGAQASGSSTSTEAPGHQFTSPMSRNIASGTSASQASSAKGRCQELNAAIDQAIASPERKNVTVRGYGPDGKPRNELQEYDKRATLETEYRNQGCR
jgi:uncharacterized membrane protein YcgQ (UPF0703/DUF1980 family)